MTHRFRLPALVLLLLLIPAAWAPAATTAPQADSVILFIGDGLGPGHIPMARGAIGRPLAIERTQFSGTAVTTSLGGGITDSAAAGTALATGHKTKNGMVAVSPEGQPLKTILEQCRDKGKAVGVVTTDRLWGATPATFLAHAASRREGASIAAQVAESGAEALLGFEDAEFRPASAGGARTDGKDLVAEMRDAGYEIVTNRYELLTAQKQRLLGLLDDGPRKPRLRDMLTVALARVGLDPDGFLIMVEHTGPDWNPGDPSACLAAVLELDEAVAAATDYANARGRTLVVVTGDHDTGGLVVENPERLPALLKVNGSAGDLASRLNADRANAAQVMSELAGVTDLTAAELDEIKAASDAEKAIGAVISARAGVKWTGKGHTAIPVPVFAFGPGAEGFAGPMDNTDIPKRIAKTLGIEAMFEAAEAGAAATAVGAAR